MANLLRCCALLALVAWAGGARADDGEIARARARGELIAVPSLGALELAYPKILAGALILEADFMSVRRLLGLELLALSLKERSP